MDRDVRNDFNVTKAVPDAGTAFSSCSVTEHRCGAAGSDPAPEPVSSAAVTFSCTTMVFGSPITACVLIPDEGIQINICGGEKSHIGAVSVIAPDGAHTDIQFPGHKDGVIAVKWASALRKAGYCPVAVSAGIHYDDLSRDGIVQVIAATDFLLSQVLTMLQNR